MRHDSALVQSSMMLRMAIHPMKRELLQADPVPETQAATTPKHFEGPTHTSLENRSRPIWAFGGRSFAAAGGYSELAHQLLLSTNTAGPQAETSAIVGGGHAC